MTTPITAVTAYTVRLHEEDGTPLDPHTAETYPSSFWAERAGSFHRARVTPGEWSYIETDDGGEPNIWTVRDAKGTTGVVRREWIVDMCFAPYSPQGRRYATQAALIYALEVLLPD